MAWISDIEVSKPLNILFRVGHGREHAIRDLRSELALMKTGRDVSCGDPKHRFGATRISVNRRVENQQRFSSGHHLIHAGDAIFRNALSESLKVNGREHVSRDLSAADNGFHVDPCYPKVPRKTTDPLQVRFEVRQ
jgi:hypothetical protein